MVGSRRRETCHCRRQLLLRRYAPFHRLPYFHLLLLLFHFHPELNIGLNRGRTRVRTDFPRRWSRPCASLSIFLCFLLNHQLRVRQFSSRNRHNFRLSIAVIKFAFLFSFVLFFLCACVFFFFSFTHIRDCCYRCFATRRRLCSAAFGGLLAFGKARFSRSRCCASNFTCKDFVRSLFLPVLIAFSHCTTYSSIISCVSPLAAPGALTCINESFIFDSFSFTTIPSSSEISHVFVYFRVRSDTDFPGETSLVWNSFSLRSADLVDKGRGAILLSVGLSFVIVPTVDLAIATLGIGLDELDVLSAFAWTLTVVEVVV